MHNVGNVKIFNYRYSCDYCSWWTFREFDWPPVAPGTSTSLSFFLCIFFVGQTGAFVADFSCPSIQKKGHRIDPAGAEKQQALSVALKQKCHPGAALDLLGFLTVGPGATARWGPKRKKCSKFKEVKVCSHQLLYVVLGLILLIFLVNWSIAMTKLNFDRVLWVKYPSHIQC